MDEDEELAKLEEYMKFVCDVLQIAMKTSVCDASNLDNATEALHNMMKKTTCVVDHCRYAG